MKIIGRFALGLLVIVTLPVTVPLGFAGFILWLCYHLGETILDPRSCTGSCGPGR